MYNVRAPNTPFFLRSGNINSESITPDVSAILGYTMWTEEEELGRDTSGCGGF